MKFLTAILFILLTLAAQATPTAEGLFRNVSNKEPSGNLIVVTAMVEQMSSLTKDTATAAVNTPMLSSPVREEKPVYYKWLISLEREHAIDLIQVSYTSSQMKTNQVKEVRYFPDLSKVIASDNSLERSLFYGLMGVLVLNESTILKNTLSKYAQGFVPNKELMSKDKINLYQRYKEYLSKRQDDEMLRSPLEPEEEEKAQLVKETLNAPMYKDVGNVKLIRTDGELVWRIDLKSVVALFSNEDHRLKKVDYQSPLGDLRIIADEYVLFDGGHELPKTMIYKDMAGKSWKLRFTGLSHLTSRNTAFTKRAQEYADFAKANAILLQKKKVGPATSAAPELVQTDPPFVF